MGGEERVGEREGERASKHRGGERRPGGGGGGGGVFHKDPKLNLPLSWT